MSDYRVILSGGLLPGFGQDAVLQGMASLFQAAPETLRHVFEGGSFPVKGRFSAEQALELQRKLERIGVNARIEKVGEHQIELEIRQHRLAEAPAESLGQTAHGQDFVAPPVDGGSAGNRAALMHCPACGQEQPLADSCLACGITFADFNERRRSRREGQQRPHRSRGSEGEGRADSRARPASTAVPPADSWNNAWVDTEEDREPDEKHFLGLFAGPTPRRYLRVFERFKRGLGSRIPLSWNWGAVFSPFLWAMYRKLWFWALVIGVFEILLPTAAFVLGTREGFSHKYLYLGWAALIGSRLFWPAVVDFLYFRHARNSIRRLHRMAPNYAADIDIATAGGISHSAVFVGITVSIVFGLFFWSVIESMNIGYGGYDPRMAQILEETVDQRFSGDSRVQGMETQTRQVDNQWAETRQRLRSLGQQVNEWLVQNNKVDNPGSTNLFMLRQQMRIPDQLLRDGWGGEVQYIPDTEGYRLVSAGPDRLFGTADDIQYRRTLN